MHLLLIHTGGTIGMAEGPNGLAPVEGRVEDAIRDALPEGMSLVSHVFRPLLDSADLGPHHWNEILDAIRAHAGMPVIITHGTDTMAFTGAALIQALAGEDRCVVLCGSMLPLGQGGDAEGNLSLAIDAVRDNRPGIRLAFAGRLLEAGGLVKHDSHAADSFRTQPQAQPGPPGTRRFAQDRRIAILTLSPGMPAAALAGALDHLDAAVLRVFGSGTAMSDPQILSALDKAVKAKKRIRAVSQCEAGGLTPGAYAAGAGLWSTGVENGGLETPEAALIHLWLNT
ncbi:asparaginase domain-containing protein [Rhizobium sp. SSA_523]|uniref:asparaginase domain-containing protein n=1 Tax=Rhizobium sp. SSA_523 TaxID=2952477 RepID=UPI0020900932|nr:asparaginase domain-containing protein [Rhizobium sp. SSA_523]MCO5733616.1 asparaginase domain-containing protein [Rhizobium sp. SSA_523]WKC23087.1 asparaginase domain-containing protein [Rhizobium sp. SSA_523]